MVFECIQVGMATLRACHILIKLVEINEILSIFICAQDLQVLNYFFRIKCSQYWVPAVIRSNFRLGITIKKQIHRVRILSALRIQAERLNNIALLRNHALKIRQTRQSLILVLGEIIYFQLSLLGASRILEKLDAPWVNEIVEADGLASWLIPRLMRPISLPSNFL